MDIKINLAENLTRYRKAANLTQAELATKLNYSDKAVSKWERGESFPDLYVLKQIADLYEVSIDTLIDTPKEPEKPKRQHRLNVKRTLISLCSVGLVWLVATCCFAFINMIFPTLKNTWLFFIFAVPITFILTLTLSAVWKKRMLVNVFTSLLCWTLALAIFLLLQTILVDPPINLWLIFIICIPVQALIIFWHYYRKSKLE